METLQSITIIHYKQLQEERRIETPENIILYSSLRTNHCYIEI